jgi:hypothetical protein
MKNILADRVKKSKIRTAQIAVIVNALGDLTSISAPSYRRENHCKNSLQLNLQFFTLIE